MALVIHRTEGQEQGRRASAGEKGKCWGKRTIPGEGEQVQVQKDKCRGRMTSASAEGQVQGQKDKCRVRRTSAGAEGQVQGQEDKCSGRKTSAGAEGQVQGQKDKCRGRRTSAGAEGQVQGQKDKCRGEEQVLIAISQLPYAGRFKLCWRSYEYYEPLRPHSREESTSNDTFHKHTLHIHM